LELNWPTRIWIRNFDLWIRNQKNVYGSERLIQVLMGHVCETNIISGQFLPTFRGVERDPLNFWKEQKMETFLTQVTVKLKSTYSSFLLYYCNLLFYAGNERFCMSALFQNENCKFVLIPYERNGLRNILFYCLHLFSGRYLNIIAIYFFMQANFN